MKLTVAYQPSIRPRASPYRLLDELSQEIAWANAFLDALRVRQLSVRSLRAYAYDLLHFARWWMPLSQPPLSEITQSTLFDYVRHQLDQHPTPTPQTVNHRLGVVGRLYRFYYQREIPGLSGCDFPRRSARSPLAYGRPRRARSAGLRLKEPRRVIVALPVEEVAKFWRSFRTFRDLALVGPDVARRPALL